MRRFDTNENVTLGMLVVILAVSAVLGVQTCRSAVPAIEHAIEPNGEFRTGGQRLVYRVCRRTLTIVDAAGF